MNAEFIARRVAFSAYGRGTLVSNSHSLVQLLNQQPVANIAVEATCLTCPTVSLETSTTDHQGKFRIRGLLPKHK